MRPAERHNCEAIETTVKANRDNWEGRPAERDNWEAIETTVRANRDNWEGRPAERHNCEAIETTVRRIETTGRVDLLRETTGRL